LQKHLTNSKAEETELEVFTNLTNWIFVLLGLLILLNALLFTLYANAHPEISDWEKIWNYADSEIARGLS